jgi:hypothetical protein
MWAEGALVNWRGTFAELTMHRDSDTNTRRAPAPRSSATSGVAFYVLVLSVISIAAAYTTAFLPPSIARAGPWLMAVAVPLTLVSMLMLGAARGTRPLGWLAWPFLLVLLLVAGGFLLALMLPAEEPTSPLVLGLPLRAAVILLGVGVVPLFILPVAYALTFDRHTLSDDDIARVRAARQGTVAPAVTRE